MFCAKCNHPNPDENNFCGNCGAPLPANGRVTLKDLIDVGLLKAGDELTISYRGKDVTASLLADGKIAREGQTYDGPLSCATAVRGQICDGWFCWNAVEQDTGKSYPISHYRAALRRQRGG